MTDFPERISISPVHKAKRDDDFYLVDRNAYPGKGTEYIRRDIADAAVLAERDILLPLVKALADNLEDEINAAYSNDALRYPHNQQKKKNDMEVVLKARNAIRARTTQEDK